MAGTPRNAPRARLRAGTIEVQERAVLLVELWCSFRSESDSPATFWEAVHANLCVYGIRLAGQLQYVPPVTDYKIDEMLRSNSVPQVFSYKQY